MEDPYDPYRLDPYATDPYATNTHGTDPYGTNQYQPNLYLTNPPLRKRETRRSKSSQTSRGAKRSNPPPKNTLQNTRVPHISRRASLSAIKENTQATFSSRNPVLEDIINHVEKTLRENQFSAAAEDIFPGSSSPAMGDEDVDLPHQEREVDLAPDRLAFRKAGDAFCREQRVWREIIEAQSNRDMLNGLRWWSRIQNWESSDLFGKLEGMISARRRDVDAIEAKIENISSTESAFGERTMDWNAQRNSLEKELAELEQKDKECVQQLKDLAKGREELFREMQVAKKNGEEVETTQQRLNTVYESRQKAETQLFDWRSQVDVMRNALEDQRHDQEILEDLTSGLKRRKQQFEEEQHRLTEELVDASLYIKTLQREVERFKRESGDDSTDTHDERLRKHLDAVHRSQLETLGEKVLYELTNKTKQVPSKNEMDSILEIHCLLFAVQPLKRQKRQMQQQIYKRLGEKQFRILVLKRASSRFEPLIGHFQTATFSDQPRYAALSYSWGDEHEENNMYLLPSSKSSLEESLSLPIRKNLFCALHRLRRPDKEVMLWVDALCINQDNLAEKTIQLSQMTDIYENATHVCIWLGEADDAGRSDMAMDFIPQVVEMAMLDSNALIKQQANQWAALSVLIRDPWFSRRWIVQEISLAKYAIVYCGEKQVHWDIFVDAIALLVANEEIIRDLFTPSQWRYGRKTLGEIHYSSANLLLNVISNLFPTTEKSAIRKPLKSLEYLVTTLQTFDVSDARDIIYALVYIASDTFQGKVKVNASTATDKKQEGKKKEASKPQLIVNYKKSSLQVYVDFTEYCVGSSHSLDIICRPWAKSIQDESLPSWIPLLKNAEFGGPGQTYRGRKNGQSFVGPVDRPLYNASGNETAQTTFDKKNIKLLTASGTVIGKIESVSIRCTGGVVFKESLELAGWAGIDNMNTNNGVIDRIWRTLIADRDSNGQRPPIWYRRACLRSLEIADTFNNGDLNTVQLSTESPFLRDYLRRVQEVTWNRSFLKAIPIECTPESIDNDLSQLTETAENRDIATSNRLHTNLKPTDIQNHLYGLCPTSSRPGDFVCILFGCSVPVILRPRKDKCFELIGEAYVHGKMNEEAVADFDQNNKYDFRIV